MKKTAIMRIEGKKKVKLVPRCEVCNARGGCSCYPDDKKLRFDRYQFDPMFKSMEGVTIGGYSLAQLDEEFAEAEEICAVEPERNVPVERETK